MVVMLVKALLMPAMALTSAGADLDHSRWDILLKQYVTTDFRTVSRP